MGKCAQRLDNKLVHQILLDWQILVGIFWSNRRVYVRRTVGEGTVTPCITPTVKHGRGCVMLWRLFLFSKSGIYTRWRANWFRLAITAYCSITRSHLEHGLWVKYLYSCKIMTKSMPVNSIRGTLKAKRNSTSFYWCIGQRNQQI